MSESSAPSPHVAQADSAVGASLAPDRLLSALRVRGRETQVTDALWAVCQDPSAASRFVRLLLDAALGKSSCCSKPVPQELVCRRKEIVEDGRVDLSFRDKAGNWHVLVELKLHSGYQPSQLTRYLDALEVSAECAALVAITRRVPRDGEVEAAGDDRWLGSIRWASLHSGLLELAPLPEEVDRQWRQFVSILEREGALGFTHADRELLWSWSRTREAQRHVDLLLDAVQNRVIEKLAKWTGSKQPDAKHHWLVRRRGGPAIRSGDRSYLELRVPEGGPERLRIGLEGGTEPSFLFAIRPPDGEAGQEVRAGAAKAGFEKRSGRFMYRSEPLPPGNLASVDLPECLAGRFDDLLGELSSLGLPEAWIEANEDVSEVDEDPGQDQEAG